MCHSFLNAGIPAPKPLFDKDPFLAEDAGMDISKSQNLTDALGRDLRAPGSTALVKVLDDAVRRVFTANKDGAVLVFGHNQPDAAYWNGVKHYGSGSSSRIRVRRTVRAEKAKPSRSNKAIAAPGK